MIEICNEFETYGYRRVGAELRHRGMAINSKKVRRLMRQNGLQPKRRQRFVATTDSNHDGPIFPDLVRDRMVDGPNQVWVTDITYIAIATGFVYMAAILDAWSRRVVGYAISRSMDARLAVAALKAAIRTRQPPKGCFSSSRVGQQAGGQITRSGGSFCRNRVALHPAPQEVPLKVAADEFDSDGWESSFRPPARAITLAPVPAAGSRCQSR
jgi:putative transposase